MFSVGYFHTFTLRNSIVSVIDSADVNKNTFWTLTEGYYVNLIDSKFANLANALYPITISSFTDVNIENCEFDSNFGVFAGAL